METKMFDQDGRIVNGEDAKTGEYPWIVSLEDKDGNYYCGGSIISSR